MLERGLAAALRQDRRLALASLSAVVVLAWAYLWAVSPNAGHTATQMGAMARSGSPGVLALSLLMWILMMAGMMLPSAAPAILLYGTLVRKRNGARETVQPEMSMFALGYLLVWTAFSVGATLLQAFLEHEALLMPTMAAASPGLAALALIAAGLYQLSPLKRVCLEQCRNPLQLFLARWRPGRLGGVRMGWEHGAYCVGCCWALMLLLFVAGVMNLWCVGLIAGFVLVEKLLPAAEVTSGVASGLLILAGLYLLARV